MVKFKDVALIRGRWFYHGMIAEFDALTESQLISAGDAENYTVEASGVIENAVYATTAGSASSALYATNSGHATSADSATTATSADSATVAGSADSATLADHANTADSATNADYATSSGSTETATYATSAGTANNAVVAGNALLADSATTATTAEVANKITAHPYYHFHGFAGSQIAGDGKFLDMSGLNHGARGNDLTDTQMFATAGYLSTVDPSTGITDSVIRIPAVNFDYSAGEKLIVWWLGKCLAEAAGSYMLGDGSSTGEHGWAVLVNTNQKLQIVLSGAAQGYGGQSAALPFDGQLHSFGLVLDGAAKKYAFWVDGEIDTLFATDGYRTFNAGTDVDTKTLATVNLGSARPAPGAVGNGIATATRALVIMRLPVSYAVPEITVMTETFRQLRTNPGKLIVSGAF